MGLQHRRDIGTEKGDLIPFPYSHLLQAARQSVDALLELAVGKSLVAVDHGHLVRINCRTAGKEFDGAEDIVTYIGCFHDHSPLKVYCRSTSCRVVALGAKSFRPCHPLDG
ncbi:MAG: hypothetical protein ACD_75C01438G0002 [uncultured bacterium]|nr:MAG: hypothetical protein ACD_75C01438G0002 [uncultured bacterium]